MSFTASNWKPMEKNSLRGFFDLTIRTEGRESDVTFILRGAAYHERDGSRWVSMPAKPYKDKAGKDGWANIVDWPDKNNKEFFLATALEALDQDILGPKG